MKLCSACLLGVNCNFMGGNSIENSSDRLLEGYKRGNLIPVCPEQFGGLPTPRSGAQILESDGSIVLNGESKVITDEGEDVTRQYIKGAYETLKIANALKIKEVILKQGSPSCGCGFTQGGLNSRQLVKGAGVTVALLKLNGIKVYTEEDL